MDQTMIHIGNAQVNRGDEVLLWGESATGSMALLEQAEKINTIPYELTCGVSSRVPRIYRGQP
jgi:alanine racemase